jgi:transposase-like protein
MTIIIPRSRCAECQAEWAEELGIVDVTKFICPECDFQFSSEVVTNPRSTVILVNGKKTYHAGDLVTIGVDFTAD